MLKIGFIVTPGFPASGLAALSVFEFANYQADKQLYEVHIMSEEGGMIPTFGGMNLETTRLGDDYFDTVVIGGNTRYVPTSPALRAFLVRAAETSRRISSICTGAFALGEAGLLENRSVTTHWLFTEELRAHLPGVRLEENRIFVVDGPIWTAAGNNAGIDMALCMLEADQGSAFALAIARIMVVEYQRSGRQPQHSALLGINPKSDRIQEALAHARRNLKSELRVEELARAAGLGARQFSRAFRAETGTTPAKAVERLRLEAARLMLEQSQHPVEFIATETGFGDEERMRRAFVRAYAHSPQALRRLSQAESA